VVLPKGTRVPAKGPVQLAHDMEAMLRKDPDASKLLARFEGELAASELDRHSHDSAGPRYRRFSDGKELDEAAAAAGDEPS
jgi:ubiquinone biosynthesis protein UbiJ